MTVNAFNEDIKKCREAEMNNHLAKPIELAAIIKKYKIIITKISQYNLTIKRLPSERRFILETNSCIFIISSDASALFRL
jgi:hypothetical protein